MMAKLKPSDGGKRWKFCKKFEIPDADDPSKIYLRRWYLITTPFGGINLHHILMPDSPSRGMHDHPYDFISIKLLGSYWENTIGEVPFGFVEGTFVVEHMEGEVNVKERRITYRPANMLHRITHLRRDKGVWTLVFMGRRKRNWGFRKPNQEWIAWNDKPGAVSHSGRTTL